MKKIKIDKKLFSWRILAIAFGILAIGSVGLAFSGTVTETKTIVDDQVVDNKVAIVEAEQWEGELGAMPGPDISSPYVSFNGITKWFSSQNMQKATTTLCAFAPLDHGSASSTLDSLLINITTGTSTASTLVFATSTTAYASSTAASLIMTGQSVASGAKATLRWLPAVGAGLTGSVQGSLIKPTDYILVQTEAAGLSGYTYTGTCKAEFTQF